MEGSAAAKRLKSTAVHHTHMKLVKPFTPHVIAWSVRKSFWSIDQKTRLQCLGSAGVPKLSLTMYPFSIPTDEHVLLQ